MYNADFNLLRELLDAAHLYQSIVLQKLDNIKEYASKIAYKSDFMSFKYELKDVLDEFDNWLNLMLSNDDEEKINHYGLKIHSFQEKKE